MKKLTGVLIIIIGVILVIISILALVRSFDVFSKMDGTAEGFGYVIGSIIFPLLLTVFGRWTIRKGFKRLRDRGSKGTEETERMKGT